MRRREWAIGAVLVLVAAVLVGAGVIAASGCAAGGSAGLVAGAQRAPYPSRLDDIAAGNERDLVATLAAAGVPATPSWGVWTGERSPDGEDYPEVDTAAVVTGAVVTVQQHADGSRLAAAYAVTDGAPRWSVGLPRNSGGAGLQAVQGGALLVTGAGEVTALDPATGAVRWCADRQAGATVTVLDTAGGVAVVERDAADSRIRMLDPATGDERWSRDFEAHDDMVEPVVAGDTVCVFAVGVDGERSGVLALRATTGEDAWSTADDFPRPVAAAGPVVLLATDAGLRGVEADTGRVRWTSPGIGDGYGSTREFRSPAEGREPALWLRSGGRGPAGITAVDPATGVVRWSLDATGPGVEPGSYLGPQVLGERAGRLVLRVGAGRMVTVDLRDGRIVGAADTDDVSVIRVVADGYVVAIGRLRTTVLRVS